jgi:hypothetical protein
MKVLVACEFSGIVREAFNRRGHRATSADLLPTEIPGDHYKGDVRDILDQGWNLMIAHPPCNHIAVSGARWFPEKIADGRQQKAIGFFMEMVNAPIEKIAIENPIGIMSTIYRKPDQIVQPWMFGHPESKATCLWLKGLPPLTPTKYADWKYYRCCGHAFRQEMGKYGCPFCNGTKTAKPLWDNMTPSGQNKLGPSEQRSADRARTYPGIAEAFAAQWGCLK